MNGWMRLSVEEAEVVDSFIAFFDMAETAALATLLAVALALRVVARPTRGRRRRSFWCPLTRREVEVEFEERGLPGLRRSTVKQCSAFESPEAVECRRRCADSAFRRRWELAVPVVARREL